MLPDNCLIGALKSAFILILTHLRLFQLAFKITKVHVLVAQSVCSTQTDPINDGGMV